MKNIGLLVRFASALAVSHVVYQTIPCSPTCSSLAVVSSFGRAGLAAQKVDPIRVAERLKIVNFIYMELRY